MAYIGLDFDGTVAEHEYPNIGPEVPGAIRVLKRLLEYKHQICLNTMRSNKDRETLNESVEWLKERGIELFGVNYNPSQSSWTDSPKVYAHIFIDDASLGCPLIENTKGRPYVDWDKVEEFLEDKGYFE